MKTKSREIVTVLAKKKQWVFILIDAEESGTIIKANKKNLWIKKIRNEEKRNIRPLSRWDKNKYKRPQVE